MRERRFSGTDADSGKTANRRALLVIDVQNEYFTGKLPVCYPENTLPNILAAKAAGVFVVIVRHGMPCEEASAFVKESHGWELHDTVKKVAADHLVDKEYPSAFVGTDLQTWLDARGIDTVVISGYMTQMCCDTTARYAMHLGYGVEFLSDATATLGFENGAGSVTAEELHRAILVVQAARFSRVISTRDWIAEVTPRP